MPTNTRIPTLDDTGEIPAYVVQPSGAPRGAIIVVQEIFGVNPGIARKAEDWAAKGYLAVAPDVFWRQEPGLEFNPDVPEEFQQAIGFMMKHDFDRGLEDLKAVLAWIRAQMPGIKTGLVGFCMGGKIAYQMAARTDIEASVGYYGVGIDQMIDEAANISGQLLLHVPTADGFVPADQQQAMHAGLDANPHVTLHDYEGLDHGFADTFGARRDQAGAELADARTEAFFEKYVG
ncbi:MAG: dienelactone hydrolase family protein [Novosphingobium sp.]